MIGSLTAIRMLSESTEHPLLMRILYILGPSLLGFVGYSMLRRRTQRYLAQEPALERMVRQRVQQARDAQRHANLAELEQASWPARWTQLAAPILGLTGYVTWIWSDPASHPAVARVSRHLTPKAMTALGVERDHQKTSCVAIRCAANGAQQQVVGLVCCVRQFLDLL